MADNSDMVSALHQINSMNRTVTAMREAFEEMPEGSAKAELQARLSGIRTPSMAGAFGSGLSIGRSGNDGNFILAISKARSRDASDQEAGKAMLSSLSRYVSG